MKREVALLIVPLRKLENSDYASDYAVHAAVVHTEPPEHEARGVERDPHRKRMRPYR